MNNKRIHELLESMKPGGRHDLAETLDNIREAVQFLLEEHVKKEETKETQKE
jgi:hypothetical protein